MEAVWAIQKEMEKEMKAKDNLRRYEVESEEELHFLDKIPTYSWTQEDIEYLTKPVSSKEIWEILEMRLIWTALLEKME